MPHYALSVSQVKAKKVVGWEDSPIVQEKDFPLTKFADKNEFPRSLSITQHRLAYLKYC